MDFRYSGGTVNSITSYFLKRKYEVIIKIFLLTGGFFLLVSIVYIMPILRPTNADIATTSKNLDNINFFIYRVYPVLALIIIIVMQINEIRNELYLSFKFHESGLIIYYKDKIKKSIYSQNILGYKVDQKEKYFLVYLLYKNETINIPHAVSFGILDKDMFNNIDSYLSKRIKKYSITDYKLERPLT